MGTLEELRSLELTDLSDAIRFRYLRSRISDVMTSYNPTREKEVLDILREYAEFKGQGPGGKLKAIEGELISLTKVMLSYGVENRCKASKGSVGKSGMSSSAAADDGGSIKEAVQADIEAGISHADQNRKKVESEIINLMVTGIQIYKRDNAATKHSYFIQYFLPCEDKINRKTDGTPPFPKKHNQEGEFEEFANFALFAMILSYAGLYCILSGTFGRTSDENAKVMTGIHAWTLLMVLALSMGSYLRCSVHVFKLMRTIMSILLFISALIVFLLLEFTL